MTARRAPAQHSAENLSPARRRAFFLITLSFPVVLVILFESVLRSVHFGPDLSLFTTEVVNGKTYCVMNPQVKSRYFTQVKFHPATSRDLFLDPKPAGTFRIFCLGGSTTVGYPYYYNGAFSSYLRTRLHATFPSRSVEIINCGMTATNSFTTLDMARDCLRYQPDLLIVYDGHNEFYGALGVSSHETLGGSRWLTNLYLRLIHWKTFLFVRDFASRVSGLFGPAADEELSGTMMERLAYGKYIPYDSPLYRRGLSAFEGNLHDLRDLCAEAGVPLILSSQVSNLRDVPPFISGDPPGAMPAERAAFNQMMNAGIAMELEGKFDSALAVFRSALGRDTLRAETWYHIARCLDTLSEYRAAREAYMKARDYDQLRFRTSSDFNAAIRQTCDGHHALFVDIEGTFMANSPDSLIGNPLLFEHLHPRARGSFLMGRAYAEAIRALGLLAPPAAWAAADTIEESRLWNERVVTDLDETAARRRTEILTSGWPFQPHVRQIRPVAESDVLGTIADRFVAGRISWEQAHVAAAEAYQARHDDSDAEKEYRVLIDQDPWTVSGYLRLAQLYANAGRLEEAGQLCRESLGVERTGYACRMLGRISNNAGRLKEAEKYFEEAITLSTTDAERTDNRYSLAVAMLNGGKRDRAIEILRQIRSSDPSYAPAQQLLDQVLSQR